jgi:hypothetical protein
MYASLWMIVLVNDKVVTMLMLIVVVQCRKLADREARFALWSISTRFRQVILEVGEMVIDLCFPSLDCCKRWLYLGCC